MGSLPEIFREIVSLLETEGFNYLVIGGIASSILGHPRMTEDVDICIHIKKKDIPQFLDKIKRSEFTFNQEEVIKRVKETGTFQIFLENFHVDFLILTTDFKKSTFSRKQRIVVYGIEAPFPTPEDLILLKIVPARHIDMADVENITRRHSGKLDKEYLTRWAQRLSDEAQDMRIYNQIEKLLKQEE
jgi:hypothetical protein